MHTIIAHCLDQNHDDELIQTVTKEPFEWYTKLPKGQHRLEVKVIDYAGNKVTQSSDLLKFL